jgi:hypothetical protein
MAGDSDKIMDAKLITLKTKSFSRPVTFAEKKLNPKYLLSISRCHFQVVKNERQSNKIEVKLFFLFSKSHFWKASSP